MTLYNRPRDLGGTGVLISLRLYCTSTSDCTTVAVRQFIGSEHVTARPYRTALSITK